MKTLKTRILTIPNLLFTLLLAAVLTPQSRLAAVPGYGAKMKSPLVFLCVIVIIELAYLLRSGKNEEKLKVSSDITAFVFLLLLAWEVTTRKLDIAPRIFLPPPENVFNVFVEDWDFILQGWARSMYLLLTGFTLAIIAGVILGLIVGWIPRLRRAVFPISKAVSAVPSMIYVPYIVMLLPTFTSASIFVIFLGIFFPTFMNMINRVGTIDHKIVDTARVLNAPLHSMLFRVILPYTLPRIINNLTVMLSVSVMTLTAAEMMGADRGMGYYVRKFSSEINYTKTIAGILFIALVVSLLNWFVDLLKKKLIKWNY
ncbi:MAG: ABC transporter permease subunit [Oscillospiraceae bacterium]|nr:ABC transporter permease subunit [Oscillospiraceae bacterium]